MSGIHGIPRGQVDETTTEATANAITAYNSLVQQVRDARESSTPYTQQALQLTEQLLKENPEFYTIWNYRREIYQNGIFPSLTTSTVSPDGPTKDELKQNADQLGKILYFELAVLLKELLLKSPKCYWIWDYRLWFLRTFPYTALPIPSLHLRTLHTELTTVHAMLDRDARNFHGWAYRRIILNLIAHLFPDDPMVKSKEQQLTYTDAMVKKSMKNYSAWFERGVVWAQWLEERGERGWERMDRLEEELERVHAALVTRPVDQSLWVYYGFLVRSNTVPPSGSISSSTTTTTTTTATAKATEEANIRMGKKERIIAPYLPRHTRLDLLYSEKEFLEGLLAQLEERERKEALATKWVLKALVEVTGAVWRVRDEGEDGSAEQAPEGWWGEDGPPEEDEEEEGDGEDKTEDREKERRDVKGWLGRLVEADGMRRRRYEDWMKTLGV